MPEIILVSKKSINIFDFAALKKEPFYIAGGNINKYNH